MGKRLMGDGGEGKDAMTEGVPKGKVRTLRFWAVQRHRRVQPLMRPPQTTPQIEIDETLFM